MKTSLLARVLSSSAILGIAASVLSCTAHAAPKTPIPAAAADASLSASSGKQTAVFAGGCFWGTVGLRKSEGRDWDDGGICRWRRIHWDLRPGDDRDHR